MPNICHVIPGRQDGDGPADVVVVVQHLLQQIVPLLLSQGLDSKSLAYLFKKCYYYLRIGITYEIPYFRKENT